MRLIFVLCLAATPLSAWEFTAVPVCTLWHETAEARLTVTWDPARREAYAIDIARRNEVWSQGPVFAMRFDGPAGLTITTNRHFLSEGGATVTVTDHGFGNVLNGLEFNDSATALLDGVAVPFPLDGAAGPVQDFRACTEAPAV